MSEEELERLRWLEELVAEELLPIIEMHPDADDTTSSLYAPLQLVKLALDPKRLAEFRSVYGLQRQSDAKKETP